MAKLGYIGVGRMGGPMAQNLLKVRWNKRLPPAIRSPSLLRTPPFQARTASRSSKACCGVASSVLPS